MDDFWNILLFLKLEKLVRKRKFIKAEIKIENEIIWNKNFQNRLYPFGYQSLEFCEMKDGEINEKKKNRRENSKMRIYNKCDLMPKNYSDSERIFSNDEILKKIKIEPINIENINIQIKQNQMCTMCGIIIRRDNMNYHMNTHLNQKPFVCTYKNCRKSFASRSTLYNHRRLHTTTKNFKCDICSATFHFNGNLQKHKATHLEATFKCTICNRMYKTKDRLKYHMYSHKETEAVVCTYPSCNKIFSNQYRVKDHLRRFHKIELKGRVSRPNV